MKLLKVSHVQEIIFAGNINTKLWIILKVPEIKLVSKNHRLFCSNVTIVKAENVKGEKEKIEICYSKKFRLLDERIKIPRLLVPHFSVKK